MNPLNDIKSLDATRWERARHNAEEAVRKLNQEPDRRLFARAQDQRLPAWMTTLMLIALVVIAGSAFWMSAGKQIAATDLALMPVVRDYTRLSPQWADVGIILNLLLGELGTILFSTAAGIFPGQQIRIGKIEVQPIALAFRTAALLCAGFALLANVTITALHTGAIANIAAFGWFLTLAPPIVVLFVGLFLERLLLSTLEARAIAQEAYQQAYEQWLAVQNNPETHADFRRIWYMQILDQLMKVSAVNRQKIEAAPHLRAELVKREFERHEWANFSVELAVSRPTLPLETGA